MKKYLSIILFCAIPFSLFGQTRGFWCEAPAAKWEDALLAGNGEMGIMVMGNAQDETIILNHSELFLPLEVPDGYLDQAQRLPKIREMLRQGNRRDASREIDVMKRECSYDVKRDPFITGMDLRIKQATSDIAGYRRGVDYMRAETFTEWDGISRRAFVSRKDSVVAVVIESKKPLSAIISLENRNQRDKDGNLVQPEGFNSYGPGIHDGALTYKAVYSTQNRFNPYAGYIGVAQVRQEGGTIRQEGHALHIDGARRITVLARIRPFLKAESGDAAIAGEAQRLRGITFTYKELMARHAPLQVELMGAVSLDLGATQAERAASVEQARKGITEQHISADWIERIFDAGRYNIICSMGTNPPNLQGLWSGTWRAAWSASYTTNGNLPTALAFVLRGATPQLMQGYFSHTARHLQGYRDSQRALFGMRGFHIPAQMTVSPYVTDTNSRYPHSFWTGGAGWCAHWYWDYYQHTLDRDFLRGEAYPIMKEAAQFYEDFLTDTDSIGQYMFYPGYSPENSPVKENTNPATINPTMEVAICRQLLRSCITATEVLDCDHADAARWHDILDHLPAYEVSADGYLREWLWPGYEESMDHRHISHLYALFDEVPEEFRADTLLRQAALRTIDRRMEARRSREGWTMAFGMAEMAMVAAHLGSAAQAKECLDFLARRYWTLGMGSYHDPGNIFNTDISGGLPYVVSLMLAQGETGRISLLPALPSDWQRGEVGGLLMRGGITLESLKWNDKSVTATLRSKTDCTVEVCCRGSVKTITLKAGKAQRTIF